MNAGLRILLWAAIAVLLAVLLWAVYWTLSADSRKREAAIEAGIRAYANLDANQGPESGGIVFTGSSSIKGWHSLQHDMLPLPAIARGVNAVHIQHLLRARQALILKYRPRALVVFLGENDLAAGQSPESVYKEYIAFIELVQKESKKQNAANENLDIWILSMKPSPQRWALWSQMQVLDKALETYAAQREHVYFVATGETLLNEKGLPDQVYAEDGIHLGAEAYRRWNVLLKPLLLHAYAKKEQG